MALETSESGVEPAPAFDRNWYRVQTILQGMLALLLCAGLAGVFGGGWLSTSVVRVGPLEVTYERLRTQTGEVSQEHKTSFPIDIAHVNRRGRL
jgi:hypothetical protein